MLPLREKNEKFVAAAFNFFFENSRIPENFWEFPRNFGNSRGDSLNFGRNKEKKCCRTKIGEKSCGAQR